MQTKQSIVHISILGSLCIAALGMSAGNALAQSTNSVDVIVEALTTTPAFYQGRALPSREASIRITAIPHIQDSGDADSYVYHWKQNDRTLFGGPLNGANTVLTTMPEIREGVFSVSVQNTASQVLATGEVTIESTEPELYFYESNPLRGTGQRALRDTYTLLGEEAVLSAESYYLSESLPDEAGHTYAWRVGGKPFVHDPEEPQAITLRKTGGAGQTVLSLAITNPGALLQSVSKSLTILFE